MTLLKESGSSATPPVATTTMQTMAAAAVAMPLDPVLKPMENSSMKEPGE